MMHRRCIGIYQIERNADAKLVLDRGALGGWEPTAEEEATNTDLIQRHQETSRRERRLFYLINVSPRSTVLLRIAIPLILCNCRNTKIPQGRDLPHLFFDCMGHVVRTSLSRGRKTYQHAARDMP
jgi:hypothetical protein